MKTKRRHLQGSVHIGDVLQSVLKACHPRLNSDLVQLWDLWHEIVGEDVAENARPAAVKGKILLVYVSSSSWIHHLQFRKSDMIKAVNQALGQDSIEEIKFKVGSFPD